MGIKNYVEKHQPLLSKTFSLAIKGNRIAHAYLLLGEPGIPLKEIAIFMAKSILCDHGDPLADETCNTCKRIEEGDSIMIENKFDRMFKMFVYQTGMWTDGFQLIQGGKIDGTDEQ